MLPRVGLPKEDKGDVVLFGRDIAIDLGTTNTLVSVKGQGVVLSEPSVVALDTRTDEVLAVGSAAKRMIGRTPANIVAVEPLTEGVIADFGVTEKMIAHFIRRAHRRGRGRSPGRSLVGPGWSCAPPPAPRTWSSARSGRRPRRRGPGEPTPSRSPWRRR